MTAASDDASGPLAEEPFRLLAPNDRLARLLPQLGIGPQARTPRERAARLGLYIFVAWCVPLVLASLESRRPDAISFLADYETHLRSLVAIPLLLFAETQIDPSVRYVVHTLGSARRCRRPAELRTRIGVLQRLIQHPAVGPLLVLLAVLAVPFWIREHTSGRETWIFRTDGPRPRLTVAGMWQAWVVVPLYAFLLLRWLWRWIVLALVFGRSASLLRPVVSHGDRCGGFSFVSAAPATFAWVIAGASSLVSARWLYRVLNEPVTARMVGDQAVAMVILSLLIAFFPLFGLALHFGQVKRSGLRRYRAVVEGHARNVERAWYRRTFPAHVASEESSSLADLNSIYDCVRTMRIIPYRPRDLLVVAMAALVPMVPVFARLSGIDAIVLGVVKALL